MSIRHLRGTRNAPAGLDAGVGIGPFGIYEELGATVFFDFASEP